MGHSGAGAPSKARLASLLLFPRLLFPLEFTDNISITCQLVWSTSDPHVLIGTNARLRSTYCMPWCQKDPIKSTDSRFLLGATCASLCLQLNMHCFQDDIFPNHNNYVFLRSWCLFRTTRLTIQTL